MNTQLQRLILVLFTASLLSACQPTVLEDSITGYVEAELRLVAAPQAGWITEQTIKEGDVISIDQVLFKLDSTQQLAQYEQARQNQLAAEANLLDLQKGARPEEVQALLSQLQETKARHDLAKTELQRIQSLVNKGLTTAEQLDRAKTEAAVTQAQVQTIEDNIEIAGLGGRIDSLIRAEAQIRSAAAQVDAQNYQLSQRTVTAQITGLVHDVYYHTSEYVPAGAAVMALRLTDQDKVRFHLSQAKLNEISIGQTITINADGIDQDLTATINYIATTAEFTPPVIYSKDSRTKLVFLIEAQLAAGHTLPPGLPVDVRL